MGADKAAKTDIALQDRVHVPFLMSALLLGVFGGFTLAVSLPIEMAMGDFDVGWVAHAQVHGHLQAVGFAGLFVLGMGLRLAPRFGRGNVASIRAAAPGCAILVVGLLLRAVAQPLADHEVFGALLILGAALELTGAAIFIAIFGATLGGAMRQGEPHALLLFGAPVWLFVQAALGGWWLTELAVDGSVILPFGQSTLLVSIEFFGVLLSAILGVGMRSFPTFFGVPPLSRRAGRAIVVLLNTGLILWTVASVIGITTDAEGSVASGIGAVLIGIGVVVAVLAFGVGRFKHRMAPASRGFVLALQPVLAWLAITGLGLAWVGGRSALDGTPIPTVQLDAIRHVFALGVVTLAIVTMAQLMLPEFASERIAHPPAVWRGAAFGLALSLAAVLRGVLPWAGLIDGDARYWAMSVAGLIGLLAVAIFGFLYARARRRHVAYVARIAEMRARSADLPVLGTR